MPILQEHNATVDARTGFHIYIDRTGMSAGEMANVLFAYTKYEYAITQQEGWQNPNETTRNEQIQAAKTYLEKHDNDINAAIRAAKADPAARKAGININTLSDARKDPTTEQSQEADIQADIQDALRKGHRAVRRLTSKDAALTLRS